MGCPEVRRLSRNSPAVPKFRGPLAALSLSCVAVLRLDEMQFALHFFLHCKQSAFVSQHILVYYSNTLVESRTRSYPIWFLFCEASVGIRERNKLESLFRKSLGDLVVFPVYLHTSHVSRDLLEEYSMRNLLS